MCEEGESVIKRGRGSFGLKTELRKMKKKLGSESRNSSRVSTSELLKLEMVLKSDSIEPSESMRGELEEELGRGVEVRSEIEMRESSLGDWMNRKGNT